MGSPVRGACTRLLPRAGIGLAGGCVRGRCGVGGRRLASRGLRGREAVLDGRSEGVRGHRFRQGGRVPYYSMVNINTGRKKEADATVLSLRSFLDVGTFFQGNHPHPASFPPGVWYILKLSPSPTLVTRPNRLRLRIKAGEMLLASGKRRKRRRRRTRARIEPVRITVGINVLVSLKAAQSVAFNDLFQSRGGSEDAAGQCHWSLVCLSVVWSFCCVWPFCCCCCCCCCFCDSSCGSDAHSSDCQPIMLCALFHWPWGV